MSRIGSGNESSTATRITTDRFLGLLSLAISILLGFVGFTEIFPLWLNLTMYAIALTTVVWAVWSWSVKRRLFTCLLVTVTTGLVLAFPVARQYKHEIDLDIKFKASPLLDGWTRWRIKSDYRRFRDYLVQLDISVPASLPPIQIGTGSQADSPWGVMFSPGRPLYRSTITIGEKYLNDRPITTELYAQSVMTALILSDKNKRSSALGIPRLIRLSELFVTYFNSSFWNKPIGSGDPVSSVLWAIRMRLGKGFTDGMLAFCMKSISDNPDDGKDPDFRAYFTHRLKIADSIVDSESRRWSEVENVIDNPVSPF